MSALSLLPQQQGSSSALPTMPTSLLPSLLLPPTMSGFNGTPTWGVMGSGMTLNTNIGSQTPLSSFPPPLMPIMMNFDGGSSQGSSAGVGVNNPSVASSASENSLFTSALTPLSFGSDENVFGDQAAGSESNVTQSAAAAAPSVAESIETVEAQPAVQPVVVPVSTRPIWRNRSSSSGRIHGSSGTEAETPFAFLITQKLLTPLLPRPRRQRQQMQQQEPVRSDTDGTQ